MAFQARAEFQVELTAGHAEIDRTGRLDFTKTWTGDIEGTSQGLMVSAGDPAAGNAGYVAIEAFSGSVDGRSGAFVFQQFGVIRHGDEELRYEVIPGSGAGGLEGITGVLDLNRENGNHLVVLSYELGAAE